MIPHGGDFVTCRGLTIKGKTEDNMNWCCDQIHGNMWDWKERWRLTEYDGEARSMTIAMSPDDGRNRRIRRRYCHIPI